MFELIFLGLFVGTLSGLFGIGGGTILIPILLLFGYEMKNAIGISVVQMVFSSIYGSYLNNKKGTLDISMVTIIGSGGFFGALLSGYVVVYLSSEILEFIFLAFTIFALVRVFFKTKEHKLQKNINSKILFIIGILLGIMSMSIGVGGSIILVPILVGFLYVPLKKAISAGLFFVVFSSIAGLISHSILGNIDYESGVIIGISSLIGVYLGVHLKDIISVDLHRKMLVFFYFLIVSFLVKRMFL